MRGMLVAFEGTRLVSSVVIVIVIVVVVVLTGGDIIFTSARTCSR